MEIEVKETVVLKEGSYIGSVSKVEYREEPYKYTDIYIKLDIPDKDYELKAGYPSNVSDNSALGKLLVKFGVELKVGEKVDPTKILVGKTCQFLVIVEKTKDGEFARIVRESLKPAPPEVAANV